MYKINNKLMLRRFLVLASIFLSGSLLSGCGSMLPHGEEKVTSPWSSFAAIKTDYDKVVPYKTTVAQLSDLGFSPERTPNVGILNHLQILNLVAPNNAIGRGDLPPGLVRCLTAGNGCKAYEIKIKVTQSQRSGNFLADFFNFRHKVKVTGWKFDAVFVLEHDMVVYKVWSGTPNIEEYRNTSNPLGPLQGMGSRVVKPEINY